MPDVVIIGGGISGLSAAYYLARRGVPSTIIESRPRLGGVIQTEEVQGCIIEGGPDSFLSTKPAAMELVTELGLAGEVIGSNDHLRKTYVRKNGGLVQLPDGLMMMVPTKILPLVATRLLGYRTKLRMGLELFRSPRPKRADQSVAEFIEDHYGQEAVNYLAEPLLSGIYGGSPAELSAASVLPRFVDLANRYGSLTRGVLAERARTARAHANSAPPLFRTLKGGMGQLVDALRASIAGHAEVRHACAQSIERSGPGFRVKLDGDWIEARRIVVACEAHSASALLAGPAARLSELLGTVPYSSSMTVSLGFDSRDFTHPPQGFGFLVPKKERRRLVACTWIGTKFAHRVPPGKIVARCFLGGVEDPAVLAESDEAVIAAVTAELQEIAGVTARPRFARVYRWPCSMAQYTVGHRERAAEMDARAAAIPGLHLAGNAYTGIGIPDCIRMGRQAAQRI
ncbi:MAG TPA: protoporphyrinogen oxidase [Bryobacteraceae bacterium]|nr:protoporphyrinogen oxidase [Bryobacteraceae bacterium]